MIEEMQYFWRKKKQEGKAIYPYVTD